MYVQVEFVSSGVACHRNKVKIIWRLVVELGHEARSSPSPARVEY